jgi:hypothetical protein
MCTRSWETQRGARSTSRRQASACERLRRRRPRRRWLRPGQLTLSRSAPRAPLSESKSPRAGRWEGTFLRSVPRRAARGSLRALAAASAPTCAGAPARRSLARTRSGRRGPAVVRKSACSTEPVRARVRAQRNRARRRSERGRITGGRCGQVERPPVPTPASLSFDARRTSMGMLAVGHERGWTGCFESSCSAESS